MYRLPGQSRRWLTNADHPFAGILTRLIGGSLTKQKGVISPSKMKILSTESDFAGDELGGEVTAFAFYNGRYWANDTDGLMRSDTSNAKPDDEFIRDTTSSTPTTDALGDIELFNGDMYVSEDQVINKLSGSTWSTPITGLTASTLTLLEAVENRLYYTDNNVFVGSVNTSDVKATTVNTLDLQLSNDSALKYEITMLKAGTNNLWIGTKNDGQADNWVYAWNGETEDTFTARYLITANVLAGIVYKKDNRPYIFDSLGRLQAFNGAGFETVAELPINGRLDDNSVHYNGMTEDKDGEILINFVNSTRGNKYSPDAPSGVWAYSPENGLYLKYPYTTQRTTETGSTGATDYAITNLSGAGAIFNAYTIGTDTTSDGSLFASVAYDNAGTTENAIFLDNSNTDSFGQITAITRWLTSDGVVDNFKSIAVSHSKLDGGDKVTIKYRTDKLPTVSGNANFYSRHKLLITDAIMDTLYEKHLRKEGFEITMTNGVDAGKTRMVKNIEKVESDYIVTIDGEFSDTTNTQTFVLENWNLAKENSVEGSQYTLANPAVEAPKIQVKVEMLTIRGVMNDIFVNNQPAVVV